MLTFAFLSFLPLSVFISRFFLASSSLRAIEKWQNNEKDFLVYRLQLDSLLDSLLHFCNRYREWNENEFCVCFEPLFQVAFIVDSLKGFLIFMNFFSKFLLFSQSLLKKAKNCSMRHQKSIKQKSLIAIGKMSFTWAIAFEPKRQKISMEFCFFYSEKAWRNLRMKNFSTLTCFLCHEFWRENIQMKSFCH